MSEATAHPFSPFFFIHHETADELCHCRCLDPGDPSVGDASPRLQRWPASQSRSPPPFLLRSYSSPSLLHCHHHRRSSTFAPRKEPGTALSPCVRPQTPSPAAQFQPSCKEEDDYLSSSTLWTPTKKPPGGWASSSEDQVNGWRGPRTHYHPYHAHSLDPQQGSSAEHQHHRSAPPSPRAIPNGKGWNFWPAKDEVSSPLGFWPPASGGAAWAVDAASSSRSCSESSDHRCCPLKKANAR